MATTNMPSEVSPEQKHLNDLRAFLTQGKASLALAIPKTMQSVLTPERVIQLAVTAARRNPGLLECSTLSIAASLIEASQLGLTCDGVLGEGYLVPRWSKKAGRKLCSFQPGYRGLIALARRTGTVETIDAEAVFEGDHFAYSKGLNDKLEHISTSEVQTRATLTHVWALIRFKGGGYQFKVMTRAQVEGIRSRSQSPDEGPWGTDYAAMAVKTVIRQLMKLCDLSPEVARTVAIDENLENGTLDPALKDDAPTAEPTPTAAPKQIAAVSENPITQVRRVFRLDPFIDGEVMTPVPTEAAPRPAPAAAEPTDELPMGPPAPTGQAVEAGPADRIEETANRMAANRRRKVQTDQEAPAN